MIRKLFVTLFVPMLAVAANAAPRARAVAHPHVSPQCSMITGTAAVTFTRDFGATLTPTAQKISGNLNTYGLTATAEPNTLYAFSSNQLITSNDGGCSWRLVEEITGADFPPSLLAAKGGRVYIWSENRQFLARYDARGVAKLKPPVAFLGIGVDKANGDRIRAGGDDGSIWESTDAGESWTQLGRLGGNPIYYRFAFDPNDLDHIVAGKAVEGASVSRDGGRTWTSSTGSINMFTLLFSPVDSNYVWAMGFSNAENRDHIYLSTDGGSSYRAVVDETAEVTLVHPPAMAAHPTNRNIVFFVFGTFFQGYGTDLFRFDAATNALAVTHNDYHDVNAIAFSPAEANLMYLGLENVALTGP
ncbi:MAG TPA: dispase autolysis-inducing protein [Thermoanaerobaculia bacterium]|nr:dispase autolysis-inducing protein [Thermoanaerobaculia bacterium]